MQDSSTVTPQTGNRYRLFATTRPSRTTEVVSTPEQLAARKDQEVYWAVQIGMDKDAMKAFGGITGSPSGTRHPGEFDDEYDDILVS